MVGLTPMSKILQVRSTVKADASQYYRIELPSKYLREKHGWTVDFLPINEPFNHDIVVFNRFYDGDITPIVDIARKFGSKIVYEIDDWLLNIPRVNPITKEVTEFDSVKQLMQVADLITCTTNELKAEIDKFTGKSDKTVVVPNALHMPDWKLRPKKRSRLCVGFMGSITHYGDLQIALQAIEALQQEIDFDFETMGLGVGKTLDNFVDTPNHPFVQAVLKTVARTNKLKNYKNYGWVRNEDFAQVLSGLDWDIGLCPLEDNPFNRSKSALKYYSYAVVGTATIATKWPPYQDEAIYTVKNRFRDWYTHLKRLLLDEKFREELTAQQRDWVLRNRSLDAVSPLWDSAFRKLINADNQHL